MELRNWNDAEWIERVKTDAMSCTFILTRPFAFVSELEVQSAACTVSTIRELKHFHAIFKHVINIISRYDDGLDACLYDVTKTFNERGEDVAH